MSACFRQHDILQEPAMYVGCLAGRHIPNSAAPDIHRQQRPSRCLDIISPPGHNRSIANHCSKYKTAITGHLLQRICRHYQGQQRPKSRQRHCPEPLSKVGTAGSSIAPWQPAGPCTASRYLQVACTFQAQVEVLQPAR